MYIIRVISLKQFKYLATKGFVVNVCKTLHKHLYPILPGAFKCSFFKVRSAFHCIADITCHLFV